MGVTEILCSFRLVVEEKTGKEIPESSRLKFLEKLSVNNSDALSDAEDNTSRPLNRGGKVDLPLLILRKLLTIRPKSQESKFLENDRLFCFISRCTSGSFKNSSATITSLSKRYLRFRRFILFIQTKKNYFY